MKKLLVAVLATAFLLGFAGSLLADDFAPPSWRGIEGSTFQKWEFSTPISQAVAPDVYYNRYGTPLANIVPAPDKEWLESYNGRSGVWPLSGYAEFTIPNRPIPNPYKDIYIQLTWSRPPCGITPFVWEKRFEKVATLVSQEQLPETDWYHSVYTIHLEPNPDWEIIRIEGDIFVDEVVIDTKCVPEPSSLLALLTGAGGLAGMFLRRRK